MTNSLSKMLPKRPQGAGRTFKCNCIGGETRRFYTNLGYGSSEQEIEQRLKERLAKVGRCDKIRLVELHYHPVDIRDVNGNCVDVPKDEDIIERGDDEVTIGFRRRQGHHCAASLTVITITIWKGMAETEADWVYKVLTANLRGAIEPRQRKSTDGKKGCPCNKYGAEKYYCGCLRHIFYEYCSMTFKKDPDTSTSWPRRKDFPRRKRGRWQR